MRLNPTAAVNLTDRAWLEAEYDFNALFVGPGKLLAAPFASATAAVNLTDRAWLEAEYDFNALFVGPGKLLAAPFASVYLEDDA
ncbi:molecular chaperone TorD family protein, partial [Salmonella enterica subsp. enterica serovar Montevideo]|nr:molecular chaperone TorD family protein [Salmonella enterica subsp. enterica serovar Montevideo]